MMRELTETYYQFDQPFVTDSTSTESNFALAATPLSEAVATTVAWRRTR